MVCALFERKQFHFYEGGHKGDRDAERREGLSFYNVYTSVTDKLTSSKYIEQLYMSLHK
jgi:hypothetical protein